MSIYMHNKHCRCQRCRARGLMGASVLITIGILFLLENYHIVYFHRSWPALLIVIGIFSFFCRTAPVEGHVQPYGLGGAPTPAQPTQPDSEVKS